MRHARYRERQCTPRDGDTAAGAITRRSCLAAVAAGLVVTPWGSASAGLKFFRIGTGSTAGTYFPVGGLIASGISNPPGSRECSRGGSCGVPGLIAVALSTNGSVANIEAITSGALESGLGQADVAYWAYTGTGIFKDKGPNTKIRTIANLYPEAVHLVVRRDLFARQVEDLRGKRISVDRDGSGTKVDALLVLKAHGLGKGNMDLVNVASGPAADMLREGTLDGFFLVAGAPATAVTELAEEARINLVPIQGPAVEKLSRTVPFFNPITIQAGTYLNVGATPTLAVGAQWLVSAEVPEESVYDITRALWHENMRRLLDKGHPKGGLIRLETALQGLGAPLHAGAERYYREIGMLNGAAPVPDGGQSQ